MNYAIQILQQYLDRLDNAYNEFVTERGVNAGSNAAKQNRMLANELTEAIKKLQS